MAARAARSGGDVGALGRTEPRNRLVGAEGVEGGEEPDLDGISLDLSGRRLPGRNINQERPEGEAGTGFVSKVRRPHGDTRRCLGPLGAGQGSGAVACWFAFLLPARCGSAVRPLRPPAHENVQPHSPFTYV